VLEAALAHVAEKKGALTAQLHRDSRGRLWSHVRLRNVENLMTTSTAAPAMTGKEIVDLTKKHTLYEWSAQSKVDPILCARQGHLFLDSGREAVYRLQQPVDVCQHDTATSVSSGPSRAGCDASLCNPFMATEPRARWSEAGGDRAGDIDTFFFTNGGAEANENAIKLARFFTDPQDHGALSLVSRRYGGAISLTAILADGR